MICSRSTSFFQICFTADFLFRLLLLCFRLLAARRGCWPLGFCPVCRRLLQCWWSSLLLVATVVGLAAVVRGVYWWRPVCEPVGVGLAVALAKAKGKKLWAAAWFSEGRVRPLVEGESVFLFRWAAVWERTGWGKGKVCVQRGPVCLARRGRESKRRCLGWGKCSVFRERSLAQVGGAKDGRGEQGRLRD